MEVLAIATAKGIHVYAVKGNWKLDDAMQSKIIARAFSMAAETERELISKRTKEALAARKNKGLPLGRTKGPDKSKLDCYKEEIQAFLAKGSTRKLVAKR